MRSLNITERLTLKPYDFLVMFIVMMPYPCLSANCL